MIRRRLFAVVAVGFLAVALFGCTRIDEVTPTPPPTATATATATATSTPAPTPTPVILPTLTPTPLPQGCAVGLRLEPGDLCVYSDRERSDFVLAVRDDGSTYLDGDIGPLTLSERTTRPGAKVCACGLETEWDGNARTITALPEPPPAPLQTLRVEYPLPPFLGECRIGMEVEAGELCIYPGMSLCAFEVTQDGLGQFLMFSDRERIEARNVTHGELTYDFLAVASAGVWRIEDVPRAESAPSRSEWINCPPGQPVADLMDAIWKHDVARVQRLIDDGVNVNGRGEGGDPPLARAVFYSDHYQSTEIVERLIAAGADVNAIDVLGGPVLHVATKDRTLGALELLLAAGADPNARNTRGASALPWTLESEKAAHVLVNAGADVNSLDRNGNPILDAAFRFGTANAVRILLEGGADVNVLNTSREPLIYAAYSGGAEKLRLALEFGADVDARGPGGRTVLSAMTRQEFTDEYMQLIDAGADLDVCDDLGNPPLALALSSPHIHFTEALVHAGATVNTYSRAGEPLLAVAIETDSLEKVVLLVEAGADVNMTTSDGRTILELAKAAASPEVVEYLIDAGAE